MVYLNNDNGLWYTDEEFTTLANGWISAWNPDWGMTSGYWYVNGVQTNYLDYAGYGVIDGVAYINGQAQPDFTGVLYNSGLAPIVFINGQAQPDFTGVFDGFYLVNGQFQTRLPEGGTGSVIDSGSDLHPWGAQWYFINGEFMPGLNPKGSGVSNGVLYVNGVPNPTFTGYIGSFSVYVGMWNNGQLYVNGVNELAIGKYSSIVEGLGEFGTGHATHYFEVNPGENWQSTDLGRYENGSLFTGEFEGTNYINGSSSFTGEFEGIRYENGALFTGNFEGTYYINGQLTGLNESGDGYIDGVEYRGGQPYTPPTPFEEFMNYTGGNGEFEGLRYQNGSLFTGEFEGTNYINGSSSFTGVYNGFRYENGSPFTGEFEGTNYINGSSSFTGEFEGIRYENGALFTGNFEGTYYINGQAKPGLDYAGYGVIDGVPYINGVAQPTFTGWLYNGYGNAIGYFIDGVPFTGIFEGLRYENGGLFTGNFEGTYYINGQAKPGLNSEGTGVSEGLRYQNGSLFTGEFEGIRYENGALFTGNFEGTYYINGQATSLDYAGYGVIDGVPYINAQAQPEFTGWLYNYGGYSGGYFINGQLTGLNESGDGYIDGVEYRGGQPYTPPTPFEEFMNYTGGNGEFEGLRYENGALFTGEFEGLRYENGALFTGEFEGLRYANGTLFTGVFEETYYINGKATTLPENGHGIFEGLCYLNRSLFTGVFEGINYIQGQNSATFTGVHNGLRYDNGALFTGQYDDHAAMMNYYYISGVEVSWGEWYAWLDSGGNGFFIGAYYINGVAKLGLNEYGNGVSEGLRYENGALFTGEFEGNTYVNGVLQNGGGGDGGGPNPTPTPTLTPTPTGSGDGGSIKVVGKSKFFGKVKFA
jgi:hypothetical protein